MKFLVDASSDARLAHHLRLDGHDVTRIGSDHPGDLTDRDVLAIAFREKRVLITDDRDFGELIVRLRQPHAGVIYLRLDTTKIAIRIARLNDVLTTHKDQLQQFLVVTDTETRVRLTK